MRTEEFLQPGSGRLHQCCFADWWPSPCFFFPVPAAMDQFVEKKCQELLGKKSNVPLMRNKWRSQWVLHWMVCPPSHRSTPRRPSRHPSLPERKKPFPVCLVCQDSTPLFHTPFPKRFKHQGTSALTLWKFCMFLRLPKTCSASSMKTATPTASGPDEILDRIWLLARLALRTPREHLEIRPKRCKCKQD